MNVESEQGPFRKSFDEWPHSVETWVIAICGALCFHLLIDLTLLATRCESNHL